MQPFIVNAIRAIAQSLQNGPGADREVAAVLTVSDRMEDRRPPADNLRLESASAEILDGGSLLFPDPESVSDADWCLMQLVVTDRARNSRIFEFRGRLPGAANSEEFVKRAYELIFKRPVDQDGMRIYPPLLESHQLTRREVLKILMDSDEARSRNAIIILIPHPSSWLSSLQINTDDDASFPSLII